MYTLLKKKGGFSVKKYIFLAIAFFLIPLCAHISFAQIDSAFDPEKIYLFDSNIVVNTDATITVTERIVVNAQHKKIRRGIYRELPLSHLEKITPISLTMDGQEHPFFTERTGGNLRINFGNDDYISKGKHQYILKYNFEGAIDFYKDYDEIYWNVTGNGWNFTIDKARAEVILPPDAHVQEEGISLYTGASGEKETQARAVGHLTFETTSPLYAKEGFTIAVPFDKGTVQPPSLLKYLLSSRHFLWSLALLLILGVYCLLTWRKVGRDPFYVAVPQYEPPKGISPAFVSFLQKGFKSSEVVCAILDLSMKKFIEIQREGENIILRRKTTDELTLPQEEDLPPEEKAVLDKLFSSSDTCVLNRSIGKTLESIESEARKDFCKMYDKYHVSNSKYMLKAAVLLLALGILPFLGLDKPFWGINIYLGGLWLIIFLMLVSLLFVSNASMTLTFNVKSFSIGAILGTVFLLVFGIMMSFPGIAFFAEKSCPLDIIFCEGLFLIGIFVTALYIQFIPNVTPAGKELYDYLKGFEKYIKIAESRRVEASNPLDSERIFCNCLPYAFAIGMYNQWMQKFATILSDATIQKAIECAGGKDTISRYLTEKVISSFPVHTSGGGGSHHSSGSYGGGHSGGGHGGGGGGGR